MEKMTGYSLNLVNENINKIKELFPNVINDGKVDFELLKNMLSEDIEDSSEKYQFTWIGKSNTIKFSQTPSVGTLLPCRDISKNWESTKNIYIEGDNVEVLKLLQKTYYNKIKMIYIDPPYNTGHDFVYNDDFKNSIENYKQITSQSNRANPNTSGRFHTDWLNMMYSRLCLARNLLSDDGVIFISIDDNEVANLRKICDEIFGDNNFISQLIWRKKTGASDAVGFSVITEYILVYVKNVNYVQTSFTQDMEAHDVNRYRLSDEYESRRGKYYIDNLDRGGIHYSDSLNYPIQCPDGTFTYPNGRKEFTREGWTWTWGKEKLEWGIKNGFIEFRKSTTKESGWAVCYKNYLNVNNKDELVARSAPHKNMILDILNTAGTQEIQKIFNSKVFQYTKPSALIKLLISFVNLNNDDIVLDFFSGSATTAHAVMQYNVDQKSHINYILVQLPELCEDNSEAKKAGFDNICQIGEERIRRVSTSLSDELKEKYEKAGLLVEDCCNPDSYDFGFKVFRLESTNIKPWDGNVEYNASSLWDLDQTIKEGRTNLDVAYEIMLKYGVFNMQLKEITVNNKTIYSVGEGYLLISLNDDITEQDYIEIGKLQPQCVVFKESGFADDNVKMNATYTLERLGVKDVKCI